MGDGCRAVLRGGLELRTWRKEREVRFQGERLPSDTSYLPITSRSFVFFFSSIVPSSLEPLPPAWAWFQPLSADAPAVFLGSLCKFFCVTIRPRCPAAPLWGFPLIPLWGIIVTSSLHRKHPRSVAGTVAPGEHRVRWSIFGMIQGLCPRHSHTPRVIGLACNNNTTFPHTPFTSLHTTTLRNAHSPWPFASTQPFLWTHQAPS